jgi:flagellar FliL protein
MTAARCQQACGRHCRSDPSGALLCKRDFLMATAKTVDSDADLEGGEDAEAGAPKRRLSTKMLIVIGVVMLIAIGGGTYAWMTMFKDAKEAHPAGSLAKQAIFIDMPEVLVNLSNTNADRPQYLKIKIVFEVPDQTVQQQIQPLMPRIVDTFQTYLRELRPSDLEGSVGLFRLREELTRRVNAAIAPNRINAVLFKEIVIQ